MIHYEQKAGSNQVTVYTDINNRQYNRVISVEQFRKESENAIGLQTGGDVLYKGKQYTVVHVQTPTSVKLHNGPFVHPNQLTKVEPVITPWENDRSLLGICIAVLTCVAVAIAIASGW